MAEPCYYSDRGHLDPYCTDGGTASYAWTYTTRLAVDTNAEHVIYLQVPVGKAEPDYFLCKHHAASWRQQVERMGGKSANGASAEYALRSIPAAEPFE